MNRLKKHFIKRGLANGSGKEDNLDFIQKLFLDSVREYFKKLKESNGKLFDVTPELEKEKQDKIKMLTKCYAGNLTEEEFMKFPTINFEEPEIHGIDWEDEKQKPPPKKKK